MLKIRDNSTPVVVLRSESHGGLNIMRSLGRHGVPVYNVEPNRWAPAFFSRYCRERCLWDIEGRPAEESLEYLSRVSRRIGRPCILIPTTDRTADFVADHATVLREWFLFQEQRPGLVRSLNSKKEMFYLARKHNIPTPDAFFPNSRQDVLAFIERARFPIMLKGIDGLRMWKRTGKRMFVVHSADDLLSKYEMSEDPASPNVMLQEYIPGGEDSVWMFNGYFDRYSQCVVGFTGKKIRQCPVYTGSTSLGICLPNKAVENFTKAFMKAVGYHGILDIGYRYDSRDNQYKVLDVNPRIGATFRLFVDQNGMDVASAFYLDLTGQPVAPAQPLYGRKWIVEDLDLVSSYRYWRDGKLTIPDWFHSLRGIDESAFLASDDPVPIFPMCAGRAAELIRRMRRQMLANLRRLQTQFANYRRRPDLARRGDVHPPL